MRIAYSLGAALLCGMLVSCTTTDMASGDSHLDGQWQLDAAASDDPDSKITAAIATAESKLRQRLASAGFSQYGPPGRPGRANDAGGPGPATADGSSTELNGDEYSQTGFIGPDFGGLRRQLQQLLFSPRSLNITVAPDAVRIASDSAPVRDYPPGDQFTRMDEYGTARVDTRWTGTTLQLRARYSSHASLLEYYTADTCTQTLTVTHAVDDPVAGKLTVRSIYRRP
jgi:hypothetical protein